MGTQISLPAHDLSAALSLTMSSDGMNTIVSASPGAANFDDFQRIILSMLFPVQVQINIIYSVSAPPGVDACAAICAKLLMSSSLLSRNVTKNATYQTDLVLSEWLVRLGYQRANIETPLQLTYSPRGNQAAIRDSVWSDVASIENESTGWLNFNCDDFRVIENPLYDRVNRVPQYGGVTAYFDSANYGDSMTIPVPPIWSAIMRGLNELASLNTKVSMQMMGFFQQLRVKYLEYLAKLNRYILMYVESGFRLTDDVLNDLAINDPIGQLDENANNPQLVNITSDSLFKFFKQLPNEFDPPQRIVKQPIIESVISQEVQRIISLFQTISARVEYDRRAPTIKPKHVLKIVVESAKVNPLVRSIFESAYRGYDISRQNVRAFDELHAMRDDFFANFYPEMSTIVIGSPEAFGLVEDIIRVRRSIERLTPAETEARSHTGIIASNHMPILPDDLNMVRYSAQDMRLAENNLGLLSALYGPPGRVISLPIPIRYREMLCDRFLESDLPYVVCFNREATTTFVCSETKKKKKKEKRKPYYFV
uniref:Core protein VP3 n=1 Tax=Melanaphis sacchari TaxID=742174 RepID=A0A2H8TT44_9HEMI